MADFEFGLVVWYRLTLRPTLSNTAWLVAFFVPVPLKRPTCVLQIGNEADLGSPQKRHGSNVDLRLHDLMTCSLMLVIYDISQYISPYYGNVSQPLPSIMKLNIG